MPPTQHLIDKGTIDAWRHTATTAALAGILARLLRGDRWCQTEDGAVLYIDDSVDLSAGERAAVLEAVREA